mgnify:FL=1
MEALDANYDDFWFDPKEIDMDIFAAKAQDPTPDDSSFEIGPSSARLFHGMILPKESPNVIYKAIVSHERPK